MPYLWVGFVFWFETLEIEKSNDAEFGNHNINKCNANHHYAWSLIFLVS